jgi:hypothetical protein
MSFGWMEDLDAMRLTMRAPRRGWKERSQRTLRIGLSACAALACLGVVCVAAPAGAEEPHKVNEPMVLNEPSEITQVIESADDNAPFDLNLSLGFQQTWRSATIRRESYIDQPGFTTGGYTAQSMNIGTYSQSTSRLLTRAAFGLYKEVALVIRMPIILSDSRQIDGVDGSDGAQAQSIGLEGAPGEQLFKLPFKSPTRSGIEYLAVGLDVGIMNQLRDPTKPTWTVGLEGRFNVSEPMHACNDNPQALNQPGSQEKCAYPSDINRNGTADPGDGDFSGGRSPGVSRGVTGLEAHTYISKRIKYIEPYAGFKALIEFPTSSSDYGSTNLKGSLVNHPPLRGTMIMGLNVIPWEVRDQFQRITFDFRFAGTYVSEGRDYSELFDALGSSDAPSLRTPNYADYQQNPPPPANPGSPPSVVNPDSQKVYDTGLSDVQQYGMYTFSASFTWQAGEYVKFNVGGGLTLIQSHYITFDQPCNPSFSSGNIGSAGPCITSTTSGTTTTYTQTGIPNPNYRPTINAPGDRFLVDGSHGFDGWLNATVMF